MRKILLPLAFGALIGTANAADNYAGLYTSFQSSGNMGFENGAGATGEINLRNERFGLNGQATLTNERKLNALNGYTHEGAVTGRLYLGDFFGEGGVRHSGYKSDFTDNTWEKSATRLIVGVGMENGKFGMRVMFGPREHQTPNETTSLRSELTAHLYRGFCLRITAGVTRYDQDGKRMTGFDTSAGVGVRIR